MKEETKEQAGVRESATQVSEIRSRWLWVEPSVWTDRMLAALENGVKGGVWYSLMDKVESISNLRSSWVRVKKNRGAAGVDRVTIDMFSERLDENLTKLQAALQQGEYQPADVRRAWIPKADSTEKRPLGIPTVRDRIVQTALRNVLEPIFERGFSEHSYGFRPGRGCWDALRRVDDLLKQGYCFVVDADLRKYFDTIPHKPLMEQVQRKVADGRVLRLIESFLKQGVMDGMESWNPIKGSPQGAVISPLLSNIYLDPLDRYMAGRGFEMVRYADDFVILCRKREEAEQALECVRSWVEEAGLALHPEKTRIVKAPEEEFQFLGFRFVRNHRIPRDSSIKKLRENLREKTRLTNGNSFRWMVQSVNRTLVGWFGYFRFSSVGNVFEREDGFLRKRFRRILQRRCGGKGTGQGFAHQVWPNSYFRDKGLFSLMDAYVEYRRSPTG